MRTTYLWRAGLGLVACSWVAAAQPAAARDDLGFDVTITLSQKAAARLARQNEAIIVGASYYGDPKPSAEKHADAVGHIALGNEQVEIPGKPGPAHIGGAKVDPKRLDWLAGPISVNVNVYSARKSSPDNLLQCDFIDGPLADARKAPVTLHCGLITENPKTTQKP